MQRSHHVLVIIFFKKNAFFPLPGPFLTDLSPFSFLNNFFIQKKAPAKQRVKCTSVH